MTYAIPPDWIKVGDQYFHPSRLKGLRTSEPKPHPGPALESVAQGESQGHGSFKVVFTVYACRPCDWDNYWTKPLQDCLRAAGLIPDDDWRTLQGQVITRKAATKAEERTEIELYTTNPAD